MSKSQPQLPTNQQPTVLTRITQKEFELIQAHRQANSLSKSEFMLVDADDIPILDLIRRKAYKYYLAGDRGSKERPTVK